MNPLSWRRWPWLAVSFLLVLSPPALATQYLTPAQYRHIFAYRRLFSLTNYKARMGDLTQSGKIPPATDFCQDSGEMHSHNNWKIVANQCFPNSQKWITHTDITNGVNGWAGISGGIFLGPGHSNPVVKLSGHPGEYTTFPHIQKTLSLASRLIIPQGKILIPKAVRLGSCTVAGHAGIEYERIGAFLSYFCIDRAHGYLLSYKQTINYQSPITKNMEALIPGSVQVTPHTFYLVTQVGGVPPIPIPPK